MTQFLYSFVNFCLSFLYIFVRFNNKNIYNWLLT